MAVKCKLDSESIINKISYPALFKHMTLEDVIVMASSKTNGFVLASDCPNIRVAFDITTSSFEDTSIWTLIPKDQKVILANS